MARVTSPISRADFPDEWIARFWGNVKKTSGCWIWQKNKNRMGYGQVQTPARTPRLAHRVAFVLATGKQIGSGVIVCHSCDNPACVNPEHLFSGSDIDNVRDRVEKGRTRVGVGVRQWLAKLTPEKIESIRREYIPWNRDKSLNALGRKYGVCGNTIRAVVKQKTWRQPK